MKYEDYRALITAELDQIDAQAREMDKESPGSGVAFKKECWEVIKQARGLED